jgi:hypothetical protein
MLRKIARMPKNRGVRNMPVAKKETTNKYTFQPASKKGKEIKKANPIDTQRCWRYFFKNSFISTPNQAKISKALISSRAKKEN